MRSVMVAVLVLVLAACGNNKEADKADAPAPQETGQVAMGEIDASRSGTPAPDLAFARPDGSTVTLAAFRGKPVLVNLWATWCAPCIAEMPSLDRLAAARAGTLAVVGVSQDLQGWEKVTPFVEKAKLRHMTILLDNGATLSTALGGPGLPLTVLYDADGKEVWRVNGPREWDEPGMFPGTDAPPVSQVRAVGQEPGWLLTLAAGGRIDMEADYGEKKASFQTPDGLSLGGDTSISVTEGGKALAVAIAKKPCADSMSGEPFDYTVTMDFDGKRYEGCGSVF